MRQFRTSDGARIAYRLLRAPDDGTARGTVVLCDGISCDGFVWRYLEPVLARHYDVLHAHYRGHGRSGLGPDPAGLTIPRLARDLDELMAAQGLDDAVFVGHSMGVQVILEVALRSPERVRAMVLLCGAPGRVLDTFKETDLGARVLPTLRTVTRDFRPLVGRLMRTLVPTRLSRWVAMVAEVDRHRMRVEDIDAYLRHVARMPPDLFVGLLSDAAERSSGAFLRRLDRPSLVVTGERDGFTPARLGKRLAEALPRAEHVCLREGTHTAPLEHPEALERLVMAFLQRLEPAQRVANERPQELAEAMSSRGRSAP